MTRFGKYIREERNKKSIPLRVVAEIANIDLSLLAKIERCERVATAQMIPGIATALGVKQDELKLKLLTDKIHGELQGIDLPPKVLSSIAKELSKVEL
jgi:transcriptional regulator with XRE-family HTH domain